MFKENLRDYYFEIVLSRSAVLFTRILSLYRIGYRQSFEITVLIVLGPYTVGLLLAWENKAVLQSLILP